MTFKKLLVCSAVLAVIFSACQSDGGSKVVSLSSTEDSLAYSLGVDYSKNLEQAGITGLNTDAFNKAIGDVLESKDLEMDETAASQQVRDFVSKLRSPEATDADKNIADETIAYAFGIDYAKNLQNSGLEDFNTAAFSTAINTALTGEEGATLLISAEDATKTLTTYFQAVQEKKAAANKVAGEAFLTENKARAEVKTTESGLQYEVLTEGTGAVPTSEDKVKVHYHGTLLNGTVFDSSVDRGEPASFPVTGVIKGWVEALQLMPTGSKWKLFIPADLAYGDRGAGGDIGPGETLIFEVELLEIEGK